MTYDTLAAILAISIVGNLLLLWLVVDAKRHEKHMRAWYRVIAEDANKRTVAAKAEGDAKAAELTDKLIWMVKLHRHALAQHVEAARLDVRRRVFFPPPGN